MSFETLIAKDGVGIAYRLDVSFDEFATIAYRWGSIAGKLDGSHQYTQRLISIGEINRGFGNDHVAASTQIEFVLENQDGGVDFLCGRMGATKVMTMQAKLYVVAFDQAAVALGRSVSSSVIASGDSKCLGRYRVSQMPKRTQNTVSFTLVDDIMGSTLSAISLPTLKDVLKNQHQVWQGNTAYTIGDTVFNAGSHLYVCTKAGTSGTSTTTWVDSVDYVVYGTAEFVTISTTHASWAGVYTPEHICSGSDDNTTQTNFPTYQQCGSFFFGEIVTGVKIIPPATLPYVYLCVVAGNPPAAGSEGGPYSYGVGITDGTCEWNYVREMYKNEKFTALNPQFSGDEIPIPLAFGEDWVPAPLYLYHDSYDRNGNGRLDPGNNYTTTDEQWASGTSDARQATFYSHAPFCCTLKDNDAPHPESTTVPIEGIRIEKVMEGGRTFIYDIPARAYLDFSIALLKNVNPDYTYPADGGDYASGTKDLAQTYRQYVVKDGIGFHVWFVRINFFYIGWWLSQNSGTSRWSPDRTTPFESSYNSASGAWNVGDPLMESSAMDNRVTASSAATFTLNRIWIQHKQLSSVGASSYGTNSTLRHPVDVLGDLLVYYCRGGQAIDSVSRAKMVAAMPYASCSGTVYPFESVPGEVQGGDRTTMIRKTLSAICQSFDMDVFMNWNGEVAFSQEATDFGTYLKVIRASGHDTIPVIDPTRIWDVEEWVPSDGQRMAPFNTVSFNGMKSYAARTFALTNNIKPSGGPFTLAGDISPTERVVPATLEASWMSVNQQKKILDYRHLDTRYRPMVRFTTDITALKLDLGDLFFFSWARNGTDLIYDNDIFRVDAISFSPDSTAVTITGAFFETMRIPSYILDSEALNEGLFAAADWNDSAATGVINSTNNLVYLEVTEGSNFISFFRVSDDAEVDPRQLHCGSYGIDVSGLFTGDIIVLQDATENSYSLFRNRALLIQEVTATGIYFDASATPYGTQFGISYPTRIDTWKAIHGASTQAYSALHDSGKTIATSESTGTRCMVSLYTARIITGSSTPKPLDAIPLLSGTGNVSIVVGDKLVISGAAPDLGYTLSALSQGGRHVTVTAVDLGTDTFTFTDDDPVVGVLFEGTEYTASQWKKYLGNTGSYLGYPSGGWWTTDTGSYPNGWDMYGKMSFGVGLYSSGDKAALLKGG